MMHNRWCHGVTARHSHTTNCLAITSSTVCMYARRAASYYCKVQCGVDISTSAVARAEHEAVSSGLPLRSAHATTHQTRSWPVGMLGLYALLLHKNRTYSFLLVLHSPWQMQTREHPSNKCAQSCRREAINFLCVCMLITRSCKVTFS